MAHSAHKGNGEAQVARKRHFEDLVAGHLDTLYRTALTVTRKREDAEDLVQETLVKAWRSLDSFQEDGNFRGWLIAIMYNAYRDRYRKQKRQPATAPLESDDIYLYEGAAEGESLGGGNPEDSALTEELSDPVLKAIQGLSPGFREPLLLVDLEGFTYQEAAEILGLLQGTVMSRLHRARKRLGRQLAEYVASDSAERSPRARKRPEPQQVLARRRGIDCGEACRHLHAYVDGRLDEGDARKIEDHLSTCRRCCDRLEFERRQRALMVAHHLGMTVPRSLLRRFTHLITQF